TITRYYHQILGLARHSKRLFSQAVPETKIRHWFNLHDSCQLGHSILNAYSYIHRLSAMFIASLVHYKDSTSHQILLFSPHVCLSACQNINRYWRWYKQAFLENSTSANQSMGGLSF